MVSEDALADLCDENGFLSDTRNWSDDIAQAFAAQEGIALTDAHWEVLSLCYAATLRPSATPRPIERW